MTDTLDRSVLVELARHSGFPCVSLYLPAHSAGDGRIEDPIRLKNLVNTSTEALRAAGMRGPEAEALLRPAADLVSDSGFWNSAGATGVALFIAPGLTQRLALDRPMPEQAVVGDRFYVRPLLEAARGVCTFYVLTLSMAGATLYRGDPTGLSELPLRDAPKGMADELRYDVHEESLQSHATMSGAHQVHGKTAQEFHGHGGGKDIAGSNLDRYLHDVADSVSRALGENGVPLVLFGVKDVIVPFRSINSKAAHAAAEVDGNPDELTRSKIHSLAVSALRPTVAAAEAAVVTEYREKSGGPLVSDDITEILQAAVAGRVKSLVCDDSVGPFGTFDPETLELEICGPATRRLLHFQRQPETAIPGDGGCWDLVDLAAAETILHGGQVLAYAGEDAPISGAAAVMRY